MGRDPSQMCRSVIPSRPVPTLTRGVLPPAAERQFAMRMGATTFEVPSSHVAMIFHPDDVSKFIETAAVSGRA